MSLTLVCGCPYCTEGEVSLNPATGLQRSLMFPVGCALFSVAFLAVGCGGGGGGDSDVAPCTTLTFDRALTAPGNGDVYFQQANSTCSTIDVSVVISNLNGIWTTSFDIAYPANLLDFDDYELGPLLKKGPPVNPPQVILNDNPGNLEVTASRFGSDPDVDAVGSETLIVLKFRRVSPGAGGIDFDTSGTSPVAEVVLNRNGNVRPAIFSPGHGGMAMVP
jgi:hypothetical protein